MKTRTKLLIIPLRKDDVLSKDAIKTPPTSICNSTSIRMSGAEEFEIEMLIS